MNAALISCLSLKPLFYYLVGKVEVFSEGKGFIWDPQPAASRAVSASSEPESHAPAPRRSQQQRVGVGDENLAVCKMFQVPEAE